MKKINKALLQSYARNLLGQVIAAVTIVSAATHISLVDFRGAQLLLVANALWGSLVPVILRFVNKKDPAFGLVAVQATDAVSAKLGETK